MSKLILKTDIKRQSGKLYFCGTDEKTGCLTISESVMNRGGKKKSASAKKSKKSKK